MNLREYAESRGKSYQTLARWAQTGRLTQIKREGRSYVISDPQALDREIAASRSPDRGGSSPGTQVDDSLRRQQADERAVPSFARSRAIREAFAAKLSELEFKQRSGKLVDKAELKMKLAKVHMGVRDALRTIPDRVAPIVAAETDQAAIHALLLKEIGQALEGLSGSTD
jgi:hypothetical protein